MSAEGAPPATTREWARGLLALEAGRRTATDPGAHAFGTHAAGAYAAGVQAGDAHAAARVFEKLQMSLARFAGPDGFASLLRRALTLARAEHPRLQAVTVKADGSLEGFEQAAADMGDGGADAGVAIAAHLLGLLVTFVGEALTSRLVRDAWPDAPLSK